jgi:hypothetical protein
VLAKKRSCVLNRPSAGTVEEGREVFFIVQNELLLAALFCKSKMMWAEGLPTEGANFEIRQRCR